MVGLDAYFYIGINLTNKKRLMIHEPSNQIAGVAQINLRARFEAATTDQNQSSLLWYYFTNLWCYYS
ncbi:hypothetical protein CLV32_0536 [Pedobacter duraquae]|uniref:Uncharacterized protein n=1 Tax=Pedobacter duraquae TaxID=425511 RepID=A0A4R6IPY0_9SPHI|nr:hypothetical protein CLV32_0536 [Pedobacter duraquae]